MPPRTKGKATAVTASAGAAPSKRRAENDHDDDASVTVLPAKKARQDASNSLPVEETLAPGLSDMNWARKASKGPTPATRVIEISSDEDEEQPVVAARNATALKNNATEVSSDDSEDDSEASGNDVADRASESWEDEDGNPRVPRKVRDRLEYIETHTTDLTSTYLKMITRELDYYMGKGGRNADVAADIAHHCAVQAQLGRSNLFSERKLVQRVYRMCYGTCGESEGEYDSDDEYDEDYEIPKEISDRLVYCLHMLEPFDVRALRKVIKKLPKYKGRRKGEQDDVLDDVMTHLDDLAAKKADIVAEAAMIKKIQEKRARTDGQ